MKPCDCRDAQDTSRLDHSGVRFNSDGIEVIPPNVIIYVGPCQFILSQRKFKMLAEWYLENQEEKDE